MKTIHPWFSLLGYLCCLFVGRLEASQEIIQVDNGGFHCVALQSNGNVWTWGLNQFGNLGLGYSGSIHNNITKNPLLNGTRTDATNSPLPVLVANLPRNIKKVRAGNNHSLALTDDGDLWVWGRNVAGQLGDGTLKDRSIPKKIDIFKTIDGQITNELVKLKDIVAGHSFTLGLTPEGDIYTWGSNRNGELGHPYLFIKNSPIPEKVEFFNKNVSAIGAGSEHALAVLVDGTVFAWGNNNKAQLGIPPIFKPISSTPWQVPLPSIPFVQVDGGRYFSLFLGSNGRCYSCGQNNKGQLGLGFLSDYVITPTEISGLTFSKISAGSNFGVGINSIAQALSWGANAKAQLGRLPTIIPQDPHPGLVAEFNDNIVEVVLGSTFALIRKSTHPDKVFAWGANNKGQMGIGTISKSHAFINPVAVHLPSPLLDTPLPPTQIKGVVLPAVIANRLKQSSTYPSINLSWKLSSSPDVTNYIVYRLKNNVPFSQARIKEKVVAANPVFPVRIPLNSLQPTTFLVVAVDKNNVESAPLSIISSRF